MTVIDKEIYPGQGITVRHSFRDPVTQEPQTANDNSITFRKPDGELVEAEISSIDDVYYGRIVVDQPGVWWCRMESVEPGAAAKEFKFTVRRSEFD